MEKKYIIVVAVLLILVAVVAFNFGKAAGMATKEAETEELTTVEETVTGENTEETAEVPGETGTTQEGAVEETAPEQPSEEIVV